MIWACFDPHDLGHVVQKNFRIKCEVICPELKPWPKLDHATGYDAQEQIYTSIAETKKSGGVTMAQTKSRP